jgi:hypothetical protein
MVNERTHVMPDAAGEISDDGVEELIGRMQHGIHICPFPADRCDYCDRDSRCIMLLRELLARRRKATGLAEAA